MIKTEAAIHIYHGRECSWAVESTEKQRHSMPMIIRQVNDGVRPKHQMELYLAQG
jgi:hypothetical protein